MLKISLKTCALFFTLAFSFAASATVQILSTRVAFNANEQEQTVRINNVGKTPELVQMCRKRAVAVLYQPTCCAHQCAER